MNHPVDVSATRAGMPIVILGGGPIGLVCALLLARAGIASEMVDARAVDALRQDRRLLALSRGTLNILESLLGTNFAPMGQISHVHVSSRGEPGCARLRATDVDAAGLGATVWYADLVQALAGAAQAHTAIRIQRPRRALRVLQTPEGVRVALDDGQTLQASLAIDAEGVPAATRAPEQLALLADLTITMPMAGLAIERFTRCGPLALLPLPGATDRMSMIWCLPAPLARARLELDPAGLMALIAAELGPAFGLPRGIGPRVTFPLFTHRRARVCEHRLVHLGNAAQSLHPVAGQGFNLGIRDCYCLVQCLQDASQQADPARGAADPTLRALAQYQRRRRLDRAIVPALTGALPRVFTSSLLPLAAARSAALATIDLVPSLRREFTRLMMYGLPR